jgi:hypothetical protein
MLRERLQATSARPYSLSAKFNVGLREMNARQRSLSESVGLDDLAMLVNQQMRASDVPDIAPMGAAPGYFVQAGRQAEQVTVASEAKPGETTVFSMLRKGKNKRRLDNLAAKTGGKDPTTGALRGDAENVVRTVGSWLRLVGGGRGSGKGSGAGRERLAAAMAPYLAVLGLKFDDLEGEDDEDRIVALVERLVLSGVIPMKLFGENMLATLGNVTDVLTESGVTLENTDEDRAGLRRALAQEKLSVGVAELALAKGVKSKRARKHFEREMAKHNRELDARGRFMQLREERDRLIEAQAKYKAEIARQETEAEARRQKQPDPWWKRWGRAVVGGLEKQFDKIPARFRTTAITSSLTAPLMLLLFGGSGPLGWTLAGIGAGISGIVALAKLRRWSREKLGVGGIRDAIIEQKLERAKKEGKQSDEELARIKKALEKDIPSYAALKKIGVGFRMWWTGIRFGWSNFWANRSKPALAANVLYYTLTLGLGYFVPGRSLFLPTIRLDSMARIGANLMTLSANTKLTADDMEAIDLLKGARFFDRVRLWRWSGGRINPDTLQRYLRAYRMLKSRSGLGKAFTARKARELQVTAFRLAFAAKKQIESQTEFPEMMEGKGLGGRLRIWWQSLGTPGALRKQQGLTFWNALFGERGIRDNLFHTQNALLRDTYRELVKAENTEGRRKAIVLASAAANARGVFGGFKRARVRRAMKALETARLTGKQDKVLVTRDKKGRLRINGAVVEPVGDSATIALDKQGNVRQLGVAVRGWTRFWRGLGYLFRLRLFRAIHYLSFMGTPQADPVGKEETTWDLKLDKATGKYTLSNQQKKSYGSATVNGAQVSVQKDKEGRYWFGDQALVNGGTVKQGDRTYRVAVDEKEGTITLVYTGPTEAESERVTFDMRTALPKDKLDPFEIVLPDGSYAKVARDEQGRITIDDQVLTPDREKVKLHGREYQIDWEGGAFTLGFKDEAEFVSDATKPVQEVELPFYQGYDERKRRERAAGEAFRKALAAVDRREAKLLDIYRIFEKDYQEWLMKNGRSREEAEKHSDYFARKYWSKLLAIREDKLRDVLGSPEYRGLSRAEILSMFAPDTEEWELEGIDGIAGAGEAMTATWGLLGRQELSVSKVHGRYEVNGTVVHPGARVVTLRGKKFDVKEMPDGKLILTRRSWFTPIREFFRKGSSTVEVYAPEPLAEGIHRKGGRNPEKWNQWELLGLARLNREPGMSLAQARSIMEEHNLNDREGFRDVAYLMGSEADRETLEERAMLFDAVSDVADVLGFDGELSIAEAVRALDGSGSSRMRDLLEARYGIRVEEREVIGLLPQDEGYDNGFQVKLADGYDGRIFKEGGKWYVGTRDGRGRIQKSEVKAGAVNTVKLNGVTYTLNIRGQGFILREGVEDFLVRATDEALRVMKGRTAETHKLGIARNILLGYFGRRAHRIASRGEVPREELDEQISALGTSIAIAETDKDLKGRSRTAVARFYYSRGMAHLKRYFMLRNPEDLDIARRDFREAGEKDPSLQPEALAMLGKLETFTLDIEAEYRQWLREQGTLENKDFATQEHDPEKGETSKYKLAPFRKFIEERAKTDERYKGYLAVLEFYQKEATRMAEALNRKALDIRGEDPRKDTGHGRTFLWEVNRLLGELKLPPQEQQALEKENKERDPLDETLRGVGKALQGMRARAKEEGTPAVETLLQRAAQELGVGQIDLNDTEHVKAVLREAKKDPAMLQVLFDVVERFGRKRKFDLALKSYHKEGRDSSDIEAHPDPLTGQPVSTGNIFAWHLDWLAMMHGMNQKLVEGVVTSDMLEEYWAHSRPEIHLGYFTAASKIEEAAERGDAQSALSVLLAGQFSYREIQEILAAMRSPEVLAAEQRIDALKKKLMQLSQSRQFAAQMQDTDQLSQIDEAIQATTDEIAQVTRDELEPSIRQALTAASNAPERQAEIEQRENALKTIDKDLAEAKEKKDRSEITRLEQAKKDAEKAVAEAKVLERAEALMATLPSFDARKEALEGALQIKERDSILHDLGFDSFEVEQVKAKLKAKSGGKQRVDWKETVAHWIRFKTGDMSLIDSLAHIFAAALIIKPGYHESLDDTTIRAKLRKFIDDEYYQWFFLDRPDITQDAKALLAEMVTRRIDGLTAEDLEALKENRAPDEDRFREAKALLARMESERPGSSTAVLDEMIEWADVIRDPAQAPELEAAKLEVKKWAKNQGRDLIREVDVIPVALAYLRHKRGEETVAEGEEPIWQKLARAKTDAPQPTLASRVIERVLELVREHREKKAQYDGTRGANFEQALREIAGLVREQGMTDDVRARLKALNLGEEEFTRIAVERGLLDEEKAGPEALIPQLERKTALEQEIESLAEKRKAEKDAEKAKDIDKELEAKREELRQLEDRLYNGAGYSTVAQGPDGKFAVRAASAEDIALWLWNWNRGKRTASELGDRTAFDAHLKELLDERLSVDPRTNRELYLALRYAHAYATRQVRIDRDGKESLFLAPQESEEYDRLKSKEDVLAGRISEEMIEEVMREERDRLDVLLAQAKRRGQVLDARDAAIELIRERIAYGARIIRQRFASTGNVGVISFIALDGSENLATHDGRALEFKRLQKNLAHQLTRAHFRLKLSDRARQEVKQLLMQAKGYGAAKRHLTGAGAGNGDDEITEKILALVVETLIHPHADLVDEGEKLLQEHFSTAEDRALIERILTQYGFRQVVATVRGSIKDDGTGSRGLTLRTPEEEKDQDRKMDGRPQSEWHKAQKHLAAAHEHIRRGQLEDAIREYEEYENLLRTNTILADELKAETKDLGEAMSPAYAAKAEKLLNEDKESEAQAAYDKAKALSKDGKLKKDFGEMQKEARRGRRAPLLQEALELARQNKKREAEEKYAEAKKIAADDIPAEFREYALQAYEEEWQGVENEEAKIESEFREWLSRQYGIRDLSVLPPEERQQVDQMLAKQKEQAGIPKMREEVEKWYQTVRGMYPDLNLPAKSEDYRKQRMAARDQNLTQAGASFDEAVAKKTQGANEESARKLDEARRFYGEAQKVKLGREALVPSLEEHVKAAKESKANEAAQKAGQAMRRGKAGYAEAAQQWKWAVDALESLRQAFESGLLPKDDAKQKDIDKKLAAWKASRAQVLFGLDRKTEAQDAYDQAAKAIPGLSESNQVRRAIAVDNKAAEILSQLVTARGEAETTKDRTKYELLLALVIQFANMPDDGTQEVRNLRRGARWILGKLLNPAWDDFTEQFETRWEFPGEGITPTLIDEKGGLNAEKARIASALASSGALEDPQSTASRNAKWLGQAVQDVQFAISAAEDYERQAREAAKNQKYDEAAAYYEDAAHMLDELVKKMPALAAKVGPRLSRLNLEQAYALLRGGDREAAMEAYDQAASRQGALVPSRIEMREQLAVRNEAQKVFEALSDARDKKDTARFELMLALVEELATEAGASLGDQRRAARWVLGKLLNKDWDDFSERLEKGTTILGDLQQVVLVDGTGKPDPLRARLALTVAKSAALDAPTISTPILGRNAAALERYIIGLREQATDSERAESMRQAIRDGDLNAAYVAYNSISAMRRSKMAGSLDTAMTVWNLLGQGKFEEAVQLYERTPVPPKDSQAAALLKKLVSRAYLGVARSFAERGLLAEARESYGKARTLDATIPENMAEPVTSGSRELERWIRDTFRTYVPVHVDPKRLISDAVDLIRTPGVTGEEEKVRAKIIERLTAMGFVSVPAPTEGEALPQGGAQGVYWIDEEGNVIARRIKDPAFTHVLLAAHMDTVEKLEFENEKSPDHVLRKFGVEVRLNADGKITSDGTTVLGADDRGAIAAHLSALSALADEDVNTTLLFTVREENFGPKNEAHPDGRGAYHIDPRVFEDVDYAFQLDTPQKYYGQDYTNGAVIYGDGPEQQPYLELVKGAAEAVGIEKRDRIEAQPIRHGKEMNESHIWSDQFRAWWPSGRPRKGGYPVFANLEAAYEGEHTRRENLDARRLAQQTDLLIQTVLDLIQARKEGRVLTVSDRKPYKPAVPDVERLNLSDPAQRQALKEALVRINGQEQNSYTTVEGAKKSFADWNDQVFEWLDRGGQEALVVKENGVITAYAIFNVTPDGRAWMSIIAKDAKGRKGILFDLTAEILRWAKANGIQKMGLFATPEAHPVHENTMKKLSTALGDKFAYTISEPVERNHGPRHGTILESEFAADVSKTSLEDLDRAIARGKSLGDALEEMLEILGPQVPTVERLGGRELVSASALGVPIRDIEAFLGKVLATPSDADERLQKLIEYLKQHGHDLDEIFGEGKAEKLDATVIESGSQDYQALLQAVIRAREILEEQLAPSETPGGRNYLAEIFEGMNINGSSYGESLVEQVFVIDMPADKDAFVTKEGVVVINKKLFEDKTLTTPEKIERIARAWLHELAHRFHDVNDTVKTIVASLNFEGTEEERAALELAIDEFLADLLSARQAKGNLLEHIMEHVAERLIEAEALPVNYRLIMTAEMKSELREKGVEFDERVVVTVGEKFSPRNIVELRNRGTNLVWLSKAAATEWTKTVGQGKNDIGITIGVDSEEYLSTLPSMTHMAGIVGDRRKLSSLLGIGPSPAGFYHLSADLVNHLERLMANAVTEERLRKSA